MDVEGVHTVEAPCKRVNSPMEDFYSPSWTCMLYGFSPQGIDCTALPLGVPFNHNQFSHRTCTELLAFRIFNPLKMDSCRKSRATQKQSFSTFFFFEMKLKKMTVKYKTNSPIPVMRITSVSQLVKCT